jgi:hypothetical protein
VAPAYPDHVPADVAMFRPMPSVGLGRRWHVLAQRLHGFALVAPQPCGFLQAEIQCEMATTTRAKLTTGAVAMLERRVCRHCIGAVRRDSRPGM